MEGPKIDQIVFYALHSFLLEVLTNTGHAVHI